MMVQYIYYTRNLQSTFNVSIENKIYVICIKAGKVNLFTLKIFYQNDYFAELISPINDLFADMQIAN